MKPAPRPAIAASLVAASILLVGCAPDKSKEPPPCPRISILSDTVKMVRFRSGPGRDITDVELEAEISSYKGSCAYDLDKRTMDIELKVGIDARLGPAAKARAADLAYFVAIPFYYPKPEAKRLMPVALSFAQNNDHVRYIDDVLSISFAVPDLKNLDKYDVILGLQLDADQLEYNRRQATTR